MRLARKFALLLSCAILAVLSVDALIDVRREIALFNAEVRRDNHALGRAVAAAAAVGWTVGGEEETRKVIRAATEGEEVVTRFVWLDAPAGDRDAPALPRAQLEVLDREREVSVSAHVGEEDVLYTYVHVSIPGSRRMAIELRESLTDEEAYVLGTIVQAVLATLSLVLLCGVIAIILGALLIGRPVHALVEHARRVGAGDLSGRLAITRADELGELSAEMNAMSERLEQARRRVDVETRGRLAALEQLRHADRLTTIGKLASGIAHEIATPLNVITGHGQLILEDHEPDSSAHQNTTVIIEQAKRVTQVLRQLLDFARHRTPQKAVHEITEIVRQVAALLGPIAQPHGIKVDVVAAEAELHARVSPEQIKQAVINLVVNAIQAIERDGSVWLRLERQRVRPPQERNLPEDTYLRIEVRDEGPGIDPDILERIFEPFVTSKEPGQGTGLGLSVARGIVVEHGGWITVQSTPQKGTTFEVWLPMEKDA
jgi:two-component system, NtrC family, sensor kinase